MTEPRNTASDLLRIAYARLGSADAVGLETALAEDFVLDDRRRIIGVGIQDRDTYVKSLLDYGDLGGGSAESSIVSVYAVRGERLALACGQFKFPGDLITEALILVQYSGADWRLERSVVFDLDDEQAALAELDRLYSHKPASPGA